MKINEERSEVMRQFLNSKLKVFVVWHRVFEEVLSVHLTEIGAQESISKLADNDNERYGPTAFDRYGYSDFEVEM